MNIVSKALVLCLGRKNEPGCVFGDVFYPVLVQVPDGSAEFVLFSLGFQNLLWFSVFGEDVGFAGLGRKNPVAVCRAARFGAQLANGGAPTRSCCEVLGE